MQKMVIAAFTAATLIIPALSVKATPVVREALSPDQSPIERIGCSRGSSNDTLSLRLYPKRLRLQTVWLERRTQIEIPGLG